MDKFFKMFKKEEKEEKEDQSNSFYEYINYQKNNFADCAICLDSMKNGDKLILIACSHIFHSDCLRLWMEKKRVCPYCEYSF